jgi:GAF domain-containing protein
MDRRPLAERALTEALLKIFAVRAAAELERARADEALRASEASYRAIFEANEERSSCTTGTRAASST